jgi:hypothetical protein
MALDLTSFEAALKDHYTDEAVLDLVYSDRPFLALIKKYEEFGGRVLPIPIIWGNPQGRSATFSNAQTRGAASASKISDFVLTRVRDYQIVTIDEETLRASEGNANAWMEARTTEIDGGINNLSNSLASAMFRKSSGAIGQVLAEPSNSASTFSVTLKSASDVASFSVGQILVIWSAESGGSQRNSDGSDDEWEVAGVNRTTGVLTLTGTYDGSGTIAADDYIFVEGDRGNRMAGLLDWLPPSAPSSTAFFGVDRSVDTRLGGLRSDGSNKPIEEALIDAASLVAREGGKPTHVVMSFEKYAELEKSLMGKVQYIDLKVSAEVGFRGIVITGPKGPIKVLADQNCPSGYAFMLQLDTWKLYSLGKAVSVTDTDGLTMLRQASADGVEIRMAFYGNLGCAAPGWNCVVSL